MRIVSTLAAYANDAGDCFLQAVRVDQAAIGRIVGNGTCPHPLEIELTPAYHATPLLLAACRAYLDPANWQGNGEPWSHLSDQIREAVAAAEAVAVEPEVVIDDRQRQAEDLIARVMNLMPPGERLQELNHVCEYAIRVQEDDGFRTAHVLAIATRASQRQDAWDHFINRCRHEFVSRGWPWLSLTSNGQVK